MQKIILFVDPSVYASCTPAKIGDLFMNRFAIDENASCEILKTFELGETSAWVREISWLDDEINENFVEELKQKGMDHFIMILSDQI